MQWHLGAFQWVYDVKSDEWSKSETLAYVGDKMNLGKKEGACRDAFNFEFLEQDDPLRKYVFFYFSMIIYCIFLIFLISKVIIIYSIDQQVTQQTMRSPNQPIDQFSDAIIQSMIHIIHST